MPRHYGCYLFFVSRGRSQLLLARRFSAFDAVFARLAFHARARTAQIILFFTFNWLLFGNYTVSLSLFSLPCVI